MMELIAKILHLATNTGHLHAHHVARAIGIGKQLFEDGMTQIIELQQFGSEHLIQSATASLRETTH